MGNNETKNKIDTYKGDPVKFIEEIMGIKLRNYQKIVVNNIYKNSTKVTTTQLTPYSSHLYNAINNNVKGLKSRNIIIDDFKGGIDEL